MFRSGDTYRGNPSLAKGYKLWIQTLANIKHTQNKDNHEARLRVWGLVALKSAKVLKGMFGVEEAGTVVANPLYYQKEDNGV